MTTLLVLAFKSTVTDVKKSMFHILTIGFLLMTAVAPLAIASGYMENLLSMLPPYKGSKLLLVNSSATSLSDSILDYSISGKLTSLGVKQLSPQLIFYSKIVFNDSLLDVRVRAVEQLENFLKHKRSRVDGSIPSQSSEIAVGILLSRRLSLEKGDYLRMFLGGGSSKEFRVSGIIDCECSCDDEILLPLDEAWNIKPEARGRITLIEVTDLGEANLEALQSLGVKAVDEQPFNQAALDLVYKTFSSIRNWTIPIHVLVFIAVYLAAVKISAEAERDVTLIRCIGASRMKAFRYLFYRCLIVVVLGLIAGVAFGVVSAQVIFRLLSIIFSTGLYAPPSLNALDIAWILSPALFSAVMGIIPPALRSLKKTLGELSWQPPYQY